MNYYEQYFIFGEKRAVLIIDSNLMTEPNIFSLIFPKELSMYKFINKLLSLFTRETVRSNVPDKVFVKQSFHYFIFKHGY